MRKHRTYLATAAAAVAALALVAGCSSGNPGSQASDNTSAGSGDATSASGGSGSDISGDVTMWMYPVIIDEATHKKFWDDRIAAFKQEYPDVNVKVEIYPWANRDDSLTTAIAANKGPDVVYLIPDQLPKYAEVIEPVDAYLTDDHKADILPNVKDSITMDGKMLGAPLLTSANALACDKKAFDAAGITEYPQTWDDLMDLAPKFKEKGIYATYYAGSSETTLNMTFYPLLWQAGGDVFNEDGTEVAFNSDAGVKALTYLQEMAQKGYMEPDSLTTLPKTEQTSLATDQVACTWQNEPVTLDPFWGTDNIIIKPPLKDKEQVGYGTVGSLSMLSSAKNKEAAGAWINFATSADTVKAFVTQAKYFSPLESTGALYSGDPVYGPLEETNKYMTVGPLNLKSREVMGELIPQIQDALVNGTDPKQALDTAAEAANSLLG